MVEVTAGYGVTEAQHVLSAQIVGTPKPQGSKRAFVVPGKGGGKARAVVVDSAKGPLRDWRGDVTAGVQAALPDGHQPITGPVGVLLSFVLPRPASAPKNRRTWPAGRVGDLDKLARSVLDSLTDAGVWVDDAQVVSMFASKDYPSPQQRLPGVCITVWAVTDTPVLPPVPDSNPLPETGDQPQ